MVRHFKLGARIFAVMAAVAMVFMITTPANATTGNIWSVVLSTPTHPPTTDVSTGNPGITASSSSASATINGNGPYTCGAASATGTLNAGTNSTSGATDPYLTFTSLNITGCHTPVGVDVNVKLVCDVHVSASPNPGQTVDSDWTDTAVTGHMNANDSSGNPCVEAYDAPTSGGACTLHIGGQTAIATYDETAQTLTIGGSGLSIVSGGGLFCGSLTGSITLSVPFNVVPDSPYGSDKINFIPQP